jgi:sugar lactone lactonase YvrE
MNTSRFSRGLSKLAVTTAVAATLSAATLTWAAAPVFEPLYDATPRALVPARTLHSEGQGVFLENIVALGDGSHAVTSLFDGRILRLSADGGTTLIATVPGHASGIERQADGALIVGGWAKDERRLLWRITPAGTVEELLHLKDAALPNGLTWLTPGVLLVADSVKGLIHRVDVTTRSASVWKADALLGGFKPEVQPAIPAVNGLKRHGTYLYASNMSLKHFVRIAIAPDGSAGAAEVYAKGVFADDFAIDPRGRIFATTHAYNSVVRIDTDRRVSVIGSREQGLQGATALSLVADARGAMSLLVVTNGGVYVPPAWGVEDAKIVRLQLPATTR